MLKKEASPEIKVEESPSKNTQAVSDVYPRSNKVALITGICGQDGSYLAELLLEKGYIGTCIFFFNLFCLRVHINL